MKRVVICADGTWDSPERDRVTHVLKVARAVAPVDRDGTKQIVFYDWGVGADRKKISGGIGGAGLSKNIMDCYRFIVHNYDQGDRLFFFGFSRGSYTVRSLAGFIRNCGILRREHADEIPRAFSLYRKRTKKSHPDSEEAARFRQQFSVANLTEIDFVGVWETIGTLGIPIIHAGSLGDEQFFFHNTEPSKIIKCARHALAIDEKRKPYEPVLWKKKEGIDLQQVWFTGTHSDIGGAFTEGPGLGDCSGKWMLDEAEKAGLQFEGHLVSSLRPDPSDEIHPSFKGIFKFLGKEVRKVEPVLHHSVWDRLNSDAAGQADKNKYKALKMLLASVKDDWSKIRLVQ